MSRNTVYNVSDCLLAGSRDDGTREFEPATVVLSAPSEIMTVSTILRVRLTDGTTSVEYDYSAFISKTYKVKDGKIKFGTKWLDAHGLRIMIGHQILIIDPEVSTDAILD
jgi:hypothetical protein